jgi:hypothetical protein
VKSNRINLPSSLPQTTCSTHLGLERGKQDGNLRSGAEETRHPPRTRGAPSVLPPRAPLQAAGRAESRRVDQLGELRQAPLRRPPPSAAWQQKTQIYELVRDTAAWRPRDPQAQGTPRPTPSLLFHPHKSTAACRAGILFGIDGCPSDLGN